MMPMQAVLDQGPLQLMIPQIRTEVHLELAHRIRSLNRAVVVLARPMVAGSAKVIGTRLEALKLSERANSR